MNKQQLSPELLDRYVSGHATLEEMAAVSRAMQEDEDVRNIVNVLQGLDDQGFLNEKGEIPMASSAAMSEGNLCDVMCELYILKDYSTGQGLEDGYEDELDNRWLKEAGTPLHNIGRILESNGMTVVRKYDSSLHELDLALARHDKVIAVVDYGRLWEGRSNDIFHAVVCLGINEGIIRIYDPAVNGCANYDIETFCNAWSYSHHYMVLASAGNLEYTPHPIDVSDVDLSEDLMELSEAIAENAHETWARKRQAEGWTFGTTRNDALLQHPDLVPYSDLTEAEKSYDRDMAMNTIRLVKKLGFNISRRYTAYCPHCGEFVSDSMNYCPNCGNKF